MEIIAIYQYILYYILFIIQITYRLFEIFKNNFFLLTKIYTFGKTG